MSRGFKHKVFRHLRRNLKQGLSQRIPSLKKTEFYVYPNPTVTKFCLLWYHSIRVYLNTLCKCNCHKLHKSINEMPRTQLLWLCHFSHAHRPASKAAWSQLLIGVNWGNQQKQNKTRLWWFLVSFLINCWYYF